MTAQVYHINPEFDRDMAYLVAHIRAHYPELAKARDIEIVKAVVDLAGELVPVTNRFAIALQVDAAITDPLIGDWLSGTHRHD